MKILLIEDDVRLSDSLKTLLTRQGKKAVLRFFTPRSEHDASALQRHFPTFLSG